MGGKMKKNKCKNFTICLTDEEAICIYDLLDRLPQMTFDGAEDLDKSVDAYEILRAAFYKKFPILKEHEWYRNYK